MECLRATGWAENTSMAWQRAVLDGHGMDDDEDQDEDE